MIYITDHKTIFNSLSTLSENSVPAFGKMSAQHMIEHLLLTVQISSNKHPHPNYFREEKANAFKQALIYSPAEIPMGFRSPILTNELPALIYTDTKTAIAELLQEIIYFEDFFKMNTNIKTINPSLGELNYDEWLIFHNKHFTHHFKQFNLV